MSSHKSLSFSYFVVLGSVSDSVNRQDILSLVWESLIRFFNNFTLTRNSVGTLKPSFRVKTQLNISPSTAVLRLTFSELLSSFSDASRTCCDLLPSSDLQRTMKWKWLREDMSRIERLVISLSWPSLREKQLSVSGFVKFFVSTLFTHMS